MTLKNFLKLHVNSSCCVSVHQELYDYQNNEYFKTYFEEAAQEDILQSERFNEISSKHVDHFNIIGGGMYKVELCIYLREEF